MKTQSEEAKLPLQKVDPKSKPGLFTRLVSKLDGAMKQKADEKSAQDSCCSGDGKNGKCC